MSTAVYVLFSHRADILPTQLRLIRRYIDDISRIVVVEGPLGKPTIFASGSIVLSEAAPERYGIETLQLEDSLGGFARRYRISQVISETIKHCLARDEQHVVILHGDTFPIVQINVPDLLQGHSIAVSGVPEDYFYRISSSWIAIDTTVRESQFINMSYSCLHASDIQLYGTQGSSDITEEDLDESSVQVLEPGWLHLRGMSVLGPKIFGKKIAILSKYFGLDPVDPDCFYTVTSGLPCFARKNDEVIERPDKLRKSCKHC